MDPTLLVQMVISMIWQFVIDWLGSWFHWL